MSEHDRTPPPAPEPATDATATPWMSPALSWAVTGVAALVALAALAVVVVQLVVLRPAVADIEEGHISSASCILANLSMALGRSLQLDQKTGALVNDAEAIGRLAKAYRADWVHPTPENV